MQPDDKNHNKDNPFSRGGAHVKRHVKGVLHNPGIKMVRDLGMLSFGQIATQLIGFAVFAYLARILDRDGYGALEYIMALSGFCVLFIDFGLGAVAIRAYAKDPAALHSYARIVPALRGILALIAIPATLLFVFLTTGDGPDDRPVRALALLFGVSLIGYVWRQQWLLQGMERMDRVALAQVLKSFVFAGLVFALIHGPEDLEILGVIEILTVVVWIGYFLWAQRKAGVGLGLGASRKDLARLLRTAAPLGANAVLWGFVLHVPQIMLAVYSGLEEAAWFAAAQRLTASFLAFTFIYHFNLYPAMTRILASANQTLARLSRSSCRIVAWGLIGPAMFAALYASDIMAFIFGAPFARSGTVLAILVWSIPMHFLSGHARWGLTAAGHNKAVLLSAIAGAVVGLIAGVILIPRYNETGAAVMVTASVAAIWIFADLMARRHRLNIPFIEIALRPLAAAGAAALAVNYLIPNFVLAMLVGLAGYLVLAITTDRQILPDLKYLAYAKRDAT